MITCNLFGRLGNQLFQIATTICYASRQYLPFCIPEKTVNEKAWPKYINVQPCCGDKPKMLSVYKEQKHSFCEITFQDDIILDGYFQSEKYFKECRDKIISSVGLKWKMKEGIVSIHVRRGDYLVYKDKHPPVSREYLASAVELMYDKGYRKFIIYSDDIGFCKAEFKLIGVLFQNCSFEFSEGNTEVQDLEEMSCCEHNIIANSSFSWWAAWLNQNPDKIIIAPKQWFGPGNAHLETKDLLPETWIKI